VRIILEGIVKAIKLIILATITMTMALCQPISAQEKYDLPNLEDRPMVCIKNGISLPWIYMPLGKFWYPAFSTGINIRYPVWIFKEYCNLACDIDYLYFPPKGNAEFPINSYFGDTTTTIIKPEHTSSINSSLDLLFFTQRQPAKLRAHFLIGIGYLTRGDFVLKKSSPYLPGERTKYKGSISLSYGVGGEYRLADRLRGIVGYRAVGSATEPGITNYNQFYLTLGYIL
jgi:hypothetical protein